MNKKFYSISFKERAVELSYQRENIKELAEELGVSPERLYKWRAAHRITSQPASSVRHQEDSQEIKKLKKELRDKELELEILKKAVHIFSKSDGSSSNL